MSDLLRDLDRACADGRITVEDADAVREFVEFLKDEKALGPRVATAGHHDLVFGGPPPHPAGCPGCVDATLEP